MRKLTGEQPGEEMCRARFGGILRAEETRPLGLRWAVFLACRFVPQPRSCPNPILLGFWSGGSLSPFPAPLPWRMGSGTEHSKLLIMAWSSWWPVQLPPRRNPSRVTWLEQKTFHHPENSRGFRSSVSGTQGRDPHVFFPIISLLCLENTSIPLTPTHPPKRCMHISVCMQCGGRSCSPCGAIIPSLSQLSPSWPLGCDFLHQDSFFWSYNYDA